MGHLDVDFQEASVRFYRSVNADEFGLFRLTLVEMVDHEIERRKPVNGKVEVRRNSFAKELL